MKFYRLLYDYEHSKDAFFAKKVDIKGLDRYDTEKGNILKIKENELIFELDFNNDNGYREIDYLCNDLSWFIVSEKTKIIFERIQKDGLQIIPIVITNMNNINNKYFLVNILNLEDVTDLENCLYNEIELNDNEKIISIMKYSIFEDKVNNDIFRLLDHSYAIFVSEKLKNAIEKEELVGFDFLELKRCNNTK